MGILSVKQNNCIQCGTCAAVCPVGVITMKESGPEEINAESCIGCGHCVAVCPNAALDNRRTPLENQLPLKSELSLSVEQASYFLRSRRSIRNYRPEQVPQEKLLQLLDLARFAPTAGNRQGISFLIISDREKLRQIADVTFDWLQQTIKKVNTDSKNTYKSTQEVDEGKDKILRGAPHLIIALCSRDAGDIGRNNATYLLAYAELFAPVVGLGTCWAGFVQHCALSGYTPLLDILNLPADKMLSGALMAGYPLFRYQRLVDRNPLQVSWN